MNKNLEYNELENVDDIDLSQLDSEYDPIEGEVTEKDIDNMIRGYKTMGMFA